MSQHIRKLEEAAGRQLLARDTHTVALTSDGNVMAGFAHDIVAAHRRASGPAMPRPARPAAADDAAVPAQDGAGGDDEPHRGEAVYRQCREILRDPVLAEDVHQQIFVQADRDLPRFARQSTVRTWLFAITRHRVLDALRSRRRAQAHLTPAEPDALERCDVGPLADALLDDARLGETLHAAIRALDPGVQELVRLHYQHGITFQQIARNCGEKPGTLATRVTRALPVMRAFIEARLGTPAL